MRHLTLTGIIFALLATECVYLEGASAEDQYEALNQVDEILESGRLEDIENAKQLLLQMRKESGDSSSLLWRLASSYFYSSIWNNKLSKNKKQALIANGLEYAEKALQLNEKDPDAHKWFAVLTGAKANSMGLGDKVRGGMAFKKHLDIAIQLRPDDPSFHFLRGNFEYEVGKLPWLERKLASAIFQGIPDATIGDAIKSFLLVNEYSKKPWKMNCVFLAKCYLHQGKFSDAKAWLDKAAEIEVKTREDESALKKIKLLRKELPKKYV